MRSYMTTTMIAAAIFTMAACDFRTAEAHPPDAHARPAQINQAAAPIAAPLAQNTHVVEIHKMEFQTKLLNVKIGDTVIWTNKDAVPHTVTANDESWDSGQLNKGESFTLTITAQMN